MGKARDFLQFWIQNSVHAVEEYGSAGASQDVSILIVRCVEMAKSQGLTKGDLDAEVGELGSYIRDNLKSANVAESGRRDRRRPN